MKIKCQEPVSYTHLAVHNEIVSGNGGQYIIHIENGLQHTGYVHRPWQIYENDIKILSLIHI